MDDRFRILLVDDNPDDRLLIRRALVREFPELEITEVGDPYGLARAIEAGPFDLVITDYGLGFTDGFALLDTLKAQWPECPVILCTGTLSEEIAVEALRKGLDDYVLKDARRFMRLPAAVRSAIDHARQRAAARAAELRYHELFDGAPVGLIRSLPDGRVLAANAAAVRITGFPSVATLLDANVADLYADVSDRARVIGALERGDTLQDLEIQGRRRDGALIWVSVNVRPVKVAGRILHYEWSLADITERRLLESQLRQAQKMEAVGQLAGGVAHDFNNLLTVIGGRCYLMLGKLAPDDALRREVELVRSAAERAARLTHQLLAFSRKQVLEPRVLDLNDTVTGIEPLLRRLIGEHIEISVTRGSGLGRVKADAGQLEQVLLNLAVNARDAMPQGGQLVLETGNVTLDERAARRAHDLSPGSYVVLSVTDSGHGMDAATRAQIFEPFFTTKEVGKGTGLGLATVYGIVKQSGGFIEVESEAGHGACFRVYLPRVDEEVGAAEPVKAPGTRLRGSETVLLVEDDESLRMLAREILTVQGYRVLEAASPREALRVNQTHDGRIHLLLTDVVMPEMNGRQLADHLKMARPDMVVLFMSGYTGAALAQRGGEAEFTGQLLPKPFTPDGLSRKVREVLDA